MCAVEKEERATACQVRDDKTTVEMSLLIAEMYPRWSWPGACSNSQLQKVNFGNFSGPVKTNLKGRVQELDVYRGWRTVALAKKPHFATHQVAQREVPVKPVEWRRWRQNVDYEANYCRSLSLLHSPQTWLGGTSGLLTRKM